MPIFASQRSVNGVFSARFKRGGLLPFLIRQVITTGYVAGGYKDGVAWRNVNSYAWATEQPTNRGDIMNEAGGYVSGAMSRTMGYVFGTNGTGSEGMGSYNKTSKFHLKNFTTQTQPGVAPGIMGDSDTAIRYDLDGTGWITYITGGNATANYYKFTMSTDTWATGPGTGLNQATTGAGSHQHENSAIFYADGTNTASADGQRLFTFTTETETNPGLSFTTFSQQKGLISKVGKGWTGNEGNYAGGYAYREYTYATGTLTTLGANSKAILNSGEENHSMSQTRGYVLGHYNGAQVNESGYFEFATGARALWPSSQWPIAIQSGTGAPSPGSPVQGRSSGQGMWSD
jgi:hypothetical protein